MRQVACALLQYRPFHFGVPWGPAAGPGRQNPYPVDRSLPAGVVIAKVIPRIEPVRHRHAGAEKTLDFRVDM